MTNYPKISIITPSYNQGEYLEQTILSILDQNYPNLEYIIIDGGSTDNSVEIIKKYEARLTYWVSEKDNGLYHALSKGFQLTTGEIMGWLNSDDMLHKLSLITIAEIFSLNNIEWVQGIPTIYDEIGRTVEVVMPSKWSKYRYYSKDFKYIQQESTYWTRKLWIKAGSFISTEYRYAGDLELWNRFFKYEKLYTPHFLIGGFRLRSKDQLSLEGIEKYHAEAAVILMKNRLTPLEHDNLTEILKLKKILKILKISKILNVDFLTWRLKKRINNFYEFPVDINFNRIKQKFSLAKQ